VQIKIPNIDFNFTNQQPQLPTQGRQRRCDIIKGAVGPTVSGKNTRIPFKHLSS